MSEQDPTDTPDRPPRPRRSGRVRRVALAGYIAAALFTPIASAQFEPCSAADPCAWLIDVDAEGIDVLADPPTYNFTAGDWIMVDVWNFDEVPHTLSFAGTSWRVDALDQFTSEPFQVAEGVFALQDSPSGTSIPVTVFAGGESETPTETQPESKDTPATPFWAVVLLLAAIARRR